MMRKRLVGTKQDGLAAVPDSSIDLERCARVELSSEDPAHPIDSALGDDGGGGWRAAEPGPQTVRIRFDDPMEIRRIHLQFREERFARTQEFSLHWSGDGGTTQDIVRQQYTFSPPTTTSQTEDYRVALHGCTVLDIRIVPDIHGSDAPASLFRLRLA